MTVEILGEDEFEVADVIPIVIDGCKLSSSNLTYHGLHGLASIRLAYAIITTTDQFIMDCVTKSKLTMTTVHEDYDRFDQLFLLAFV